MKKKKYRKKVVDEKNIPRNILEKLSTETYILRSTIRPSKACPYSTVTLLAKLRGLSMSQPRSRAT